MAPKNLALAIVPGSFSPFAYYVPVIQLLHSHFAAIQFISYPSIGRKDPAPAATMADDAAYIHSELEKLADSGYDVLVNAHSYGGIPTSEALRGLSKAEREKAGKAGGVVRISYTAALTPPVGKGLNDVMAAASDGQEATKEEKADDGKASDKPMISVNGDYMALDPEQNAANNFSGLPFEAALEWAKKMPEHSTLSFSGPLTHPGYKDVPVTYIFTEQDRTVPPAMQRAQIATIEEARGGKVEVLPIPTDHFPYVTATEEMAGALRKVLAAL